MIPTSQATVDFSQRMLNLFNQINTMLTTGQYTEEQFNQVSIEFGQLHTDFQELQRSSMQQQPPMSSVQHPQGMVSGQNDDITVNTGTVITDDVSEISDVDVGGPDELPLDEPLPDLQQDSNTVEQKTGEFDAAKLDSAREKSAGIFKGCPG